MHNGPQNIQSEGRLIEVGSKEGCGESESPEGARGVEEEAGVKVAKRPRIPRMKNRICSVAGCGKKHVSQGYCCAHLQRLMKHGSLMEDIPVSKSRYGKRNSRWIGGSIDDGHGRTLVYSPGHPYPSSYGTHVYRYRLVVEKNIGRYLLPSEIVHHKNGDHTDDRIENLQVVSQSEHAKIHMAERLSRNGGWSFSHEKCLSCGTRDHKHEGKGLCIKCYRKRKPSK